MEKNLVHGGYGNTPLECTAQSDLIPCVDWVSATFVFEKKISEILKLIRRPQSDFELLFNGRFGYNRMMISNVGITIYFSETISDISNPGIMLEISGQGCRHLEKMWPSDYSWIDFFNELKRLGYKNLTRLDVAIDDFKGYLTIPQMYNKLRDGCMTSSAGLRKFRHFESGEIDSGEITGETLYFGKGDIMFRFYDKKGERLARGNELDESIEIWNRYEIQLRHERAEVALNIIANGGMEIGEFVKGVMSQYLTFRIKNPNDSNKRRWKICPWWQKFLDEVEPLRLTLVHPENTLIRSQNWIMKSASATIAMLQELYGDDQLVMEAIAAIGRKKMTDKHRKMIDDHLYDEDYKEVMKNRAVEQLEEYLNQKNICQVHDDLTDTRD